MIGTEMERHQTYKLFLLTRREKNQTPQFSFGGNYAAKESIEFIFPWYKCIYIIKLEVPLWLGDFPQRQVRQETRSKMGSKQDNRLARR